MERIIWYLRVIGYLRDERGIETLEWILIGGLITGAAVAIYQGSLLTGLTTAINAIVAAITKAMP